MTTSTALPFWPRLGHFWTVANLFSLARLVMAFPLAWLIWKEGPLSWIVVLTLLAIASDFFDGVLARWSHTVSDWGKVLDPVADKVSGLLVVLALVARGSLPVWLLVVVLVRDVLIVLGWLVIGRRTGLVLMSQMPGKLAVVALALTVVMALLRADPPILNLFLMGTTGLLAYSFLHYAVRFFRLSRHPVPAEAPATLVPDPSAVVPDPPA